MGHEKLPLLLLLAGFPTRHAVAAPTADVTLRVAPERDVLYSQGPREVIVQINLDARRADRTTRAPMNLSVVFAEEIGAS